MFLRQSTSQVIRFGPCLDITDGVTEETALTLAQADMRLSKDGGAFAQKSAAGNATHDSDGWYSTTLSTTDTNTVGELILNVHQPANMLPVWQRYWVVEEAVYDAHYGAAATGPAQAGDAMDLVANAVDATSVATDAIDADALATDAVEEIADQVWDEILTGATHNIATSAGRRLREIADANIIASGTFQAGSTTTSLVLAAGEPATNGFYQHTLIRMIDGAAAGQERVISSYTGATKAAVVSPALVTAAPSSGDEYEIISGGAVHAATVAPGYVGGAVWIDTVGGAAGTELYVNGTADNPSDSIADATTIATALNLKVFHLLPSSSITLAQAYDGYEFIGFGYTVALGGQSVSGTLFDSAVISGNDDGSNATSTTYVSCAMGTNTLGRHILKGCRLTGAITFQEATDYFWDQCFSGVAGTGTPSVDFQAAAETKNLSVRHYSGGLEFQNFGNTGTHTASVEGHGQIVLNVNCAGGTIAIRGNLTVTDNAGGAVTLSDDARIDVAQINGEMVDVMDTDTITLPGQTAPPLAPTQRQAIGWLYKVFRNRKTQTATQWSLLADNETTVDAKATVSDDGTTAIKQEVVTGP